MIALGLFCILGLFCLHSATARPALGERNAIVNAAGVHVKLITTRACAIHEHPDLSSATEPCGAFRVWYIFPPDDVSGTTGAQSTGYLRNGFYRVASGPTQRPLGWLHQDDSIEWHHRQALRFASRGDRELAYFFEHQGDAIHFLESADPQNATHREPEFVGSELMPLMSSRLISIDEEELRIFELAFLSSNSAASPDEVREQATLDIVFVVDTTLSMDVTVAGIIKSITSLTKRLQVSEQSWNRLRFGLVGYRDASNLAPPAGYLAKVFCTLEQGADHQTFLRALEAVKPDCRGGGDRPEDALAGLHLAMNPAALKWNRYAWKIIALVSDSSIKGPDHDLPEFRDNDARRTIEQMKQKAQPRSGAPLEILASSFQIMGIFVKSEDHPEDAAIGERQFAELCDGARYKGPLLTIAAQEDFSEMLANELFTTYSDFSSTITQLGQAGKRDAVGKSAAQKFFGSVLDSLDATPEGFTSRYCLEYDSDGYRLFIPHLFVRRGDLQSFNKLLSLLLRNFEDDANPNDRDISGLVMQLQTITTNVNLGESMSASLQLDQVVEAVLGFPLRTRIFNVTLDAIAAMSKSDFASWVQGIGRCQASLTAVLENPSLWNKLYPTDRERDLHAFVPLSDLP